MTIALLSFLTMLAWVVVPVLLVGGAVLLMRAAHHQRARRLTRWQTYHRMIHRGGEELIEVGIRRGIGSGAQRMPLEELDPDIIAESEDALYRAQHKADNAAKRLNLNNDQSE